MARSLFVNALVVAALLAPRVAWSQVSAGDRADIVRLAHARGASDADVAALVQDIDDAAQRGVPEMPLVNKAKEGLSKGYPAARVHTVVKDLVGHLDRARDVIGTAAESAAGARAVIIVGEALFRGVTRDEVTELRRLLEQGGTASAADKLALGAQTWALLREAGFAAPATLPRVAEAVRQGYREAELLTLAREAVRTRAQPERIFPPRETREAPVRPNVPERPAAPERPSVPERPEAPERPARPERVEPQRPATR